jgi:hypothetical protein
MTSASPLPNVGTAIIGVSASGVQAAEMQRSLSVQSFCWPLCSRSLKTNSERWACLFDCPVTTIARAAMYNVIQASINGESKLQQCLNLSCDKKKVARFVFCDFWNDKHALLSKAIAMFFAEGAFAMHISMVLLSLMFLSPPLRGAGPMALMLGHEWQHIEREMGMPACWSALALSCWIRVEYLNHIQWAAVGRVHIQ